MPLSASCLGTHCAGPTFPAVREEKAGNRKREELVFKCTVRHPQTAKASVKCADWWHRVYSRDLVADRTRGDVGSLSYHLPASAVPLQA